MSPLTKLCSFIGRICPVNRAHARTRHHTRTHQQIILHVVIGPELGLHLQLTGDVYVIY